MTVRSSSSRRLLSLDLARSAALLGMVIFHFAFDLEMFGYIAPGTTTSGGWAVFARIVAGSFLFVAGASLYLAHRSGIRWRGFLRRLTVLAAAAALVTVATYIAMPARYVYFGILHSIAVASVVGLLFLRIPAPVTLVIAGFALFVPYLFRHEVFNAPWLYWIGLSTQWARAIDFEPVFPWVAPFLAGLAIAKLLPVSIGETPVSPLAKAATWPGRHSLAIYLVHQPVLIGLVWIYTQIAR